MTRPEYEDMMKSRVKKLEKSDTDTKLIDHALFTNGLSDVRNLIYEYAFHAEPRWLKNTFTFFNNPSLQWKILTLAYYAAPLDQVEACIRKAYAKKEAHLPDTLMQAAIQAIQMGDMTLSDEKGIICEGMANRLILLDQTFYPDTFPERLEKIRSAVPIENEKQKQDREQFNQEIITQVFNAIKKNDNNTIFTIEAFGNWAKETTVINQIHLIYLATKELAERGSELPKIDEQDLGGWYGTLGNQFCHGVIGRELQKNLRSPWIQQLFSDGIFYIFNRIKAVARYIDTDSSSFCAPPGTSLSLGNNFYYDIYGSRCPGAGQGRDVRGVWCEPSLQNASRRADPAR